MGALGAGAKSELRGINMECNRYVMNFGHKGINLDGIG